jgi:hypothetical protein
MMLPRFLRQWMALVLVTGSDEIGGALHDYKNGRWEELAKWNTDEESNAAMSILSAMFQNERDEIYVVCVKVEGFGRGYFVVYDSNQNMYRRSYWMGIYDPDEALVDVIEYCRKVADKMGYRRPEEI